MNDKTQEELLPPDDLAPAKKKKKKGKTKKFKSAKLVKVRNISGRNIPGYNVIYQPGDTFEIAEAAAEMLIKQNRVELANADSDTT